MQAYDVWEAEDEIRQAQSKAERQRQKLEAEQARILAQAEQL